jgi:tetratricopeptide (TPR) repeat protein
VPKTAAEQPRPIANRPRDNILSHNAVAWVTLVLAARAVVAQVPGGYVDPAVCATCHAETARSYAKTGMGRSFRRFTAPSLPEDFAVKNTFDHEPSGSSFQMIARDGKYYQRRWQTGYRGAETNVEEKQIDYVIGSGNHARTYLHLTSRNTLQQLPVSWYAETGGSWGMSPGYDNQDHLFSLRTLSYECMACHNGYPRIPEANRDFDSDPVFVAPLPEGIDCQRCHGPGHRHVEAARAGSSVTSLRASIVNPGRLDATRRMEVCLQCHLETTSSPLPHSIARYDRGPFRFQPGQPLGDSVLFFQASPEGVREDRFEIADTVGRLRKSRCFAESGGALQCTTCHDVHGPERGREAEARYVAACRQCHSAAFDRLMEEGRHAAGGNCLACHMPKRRTDDAVHVIMTDHTIRREPPSRDLLAPLAERGVNATGEREVILYYPEPLPHTTENELYLAVAQIRDRTNLRAGVARLQELIQHDRPERAEFYFELANGLLALRQTDGAVANYEEAVRRNPRSLPMTRQLANALVEAQQNAKAEAVIRGAIARWASDPGLWSRLGQLCMKDGRKEEADAAFRKALSFDPELPDVWNSLGSILAQAGDAAEAEKAFREAARIAPGLAEAYANLGMLLADQDAAQAEYLFGRAVGLEPRSAGDRIEYSLLLAGNAKYSEAEEQARAAVDADGSSAEARELWGRLMARRGDGAEAIREFQVAVKLQPNFALAHFELAGELAKKGDIAAAIPHLREAAGSSDATIRDAALRGLKALGGGR